MRCSEIVLLLIGLASILFGAIFIVGGLANVADPPEGGSVSTFLVATLFFGVVPLVAGIWLCLRLRRSAKRRARESGERMILKLAQERGGRLTVADVAMNTDLSSEQAKSLLDQCNLDRLAEMGVSESGVVVYTFRGMSPAGD